MPSIEQIEPESYITSSYMDEELSLKELVLCDEQVRIINVVDVIDSAREDGILKHNSLIDGKVQALSITEIRRVLSRHPSVEQAMQHITASVLFKTEGNTAGAALNRLIIGLRMGGVKSRTNYAPVLNGAEFNAGMDANVAITNFSAYLETLDAETKKTVMQAALISRSTDPQHEVVKLTTLTVGDCWNLLINPRYRKYDEQETNYCVELIANDLEEILEANPFLYNLVSCLGDALINYAQLQENVAYSMGILHDKLSELEQHACYPHPSPAFERSLLNVLKEERIPLRVQELQFLIQLYESNADNASLKKQIKSLLKSNHYSSDEEKKLSLHDQTIYAVLKPETPKKSVSASNPALLFSRKRKKMASATSNGIDELNADDNEERPHKMNLRSISRTP